MMKYLIVIVIFCSQLSVAQDVLWVEQTSKLIQLEQWRWQGFTLGQQWLVDVEMTINKKDADEIHQFKSGWLSLTDAVVAPLSAQDLWQLSNREFDAPIVVFDRQPQSVLKEFKSSPLLQIGLTNTEWLDVVADWLKANDVRVISSRLRVDSSVANQLLSKGVVVEFFAKTQDWTTMTVTEELDKPLLVLWHQENHPANYLSAKQIFTTSQLPYIENEQENHLRLVNYEPWVFRNSVNDWFVLNYQKHYASLPNEYAAQGFSTALLLAVQSGSENVQSLVGDDVSDRTLTSLYILSGHKQWVRIEEVLSLPEIEIAE